MQGELPQVHAAYLMFIVICEVSECPVGQHPGIQGSGDDLITIITITVGLTSLAMPR